MAGSSMADYVPDPQRLPEYLSYSTYLTTLDEVVYTTQTIVQLPQTYYGPSIPLDPAWTYGGLTSPPPGVIDPAISSKDPGSSPTPLPTSLTRERSSVTPPPTPPPAPTTSPNASPRITPITPISPPGSDVSQLPSPSDASSLSTPLSTPSSSSTSTSGSSTPTSSGLFRKKLILAITLPLLVLLLLLLLLLLWRNRKKRYHPVPTFSQSRTQSAGPALANPPRGEENRNSIISGVGVGSLGNVTVTSNTGDTVDGNERGEREVDMRGFRSEGEVRWIPALLTATGIRQRSLSSRIRTSHPGPGQNDRRGNRVPSNNPWGEESEFEMIQVPLTRGEAEAEREGQGEMGELGEMNEGGGGMDEPQRPSTLIPLSTAPKGKGKGKGGKKPLLALLGLGRRSLPIPIPIPIPDPTVTRPLLPTPEPDGSGAITRPTPPPYSPPEPNTFPAPGPSQTPLERPERTHVRDESFPSISGPDQGGGLFYTPARTSDTTDHGPDEGEILREQHGTRGTRFSFPYPEGLSSVEGGGSGGSREQIRTGSAVGAGDIGELGMGLRAEDAVVLAPVLAITGRTTDSRTTTTTTDLGGKRLRFPPPPERRVSIGTSSGGTGLTTFHSVPEEGNVLTRRSRSSTTASSNDEGFYSSTEGVDEYGRRIGRRGSQGEDSYGRSSALLTTDPVRHSALVPLDQTPLPLDRQSFPLSALPSPIPDPGGQDHSRLSLIAGSISSLFDAKRTSTSVSSETEPVFHPSLSFPDSAVPTRGPGEEHQGNRGSYIGQPLVDVEVYRQALLGKVGPPVTTSETRGGRQESSGETRSSYARDLSSPGILSEESGATFGVSKTRGEQVSSGSESLHERLHGAGEPDRKVEGGMGEVITPFRFKGKGRDVSGISEFGEKEPVQDVPQSRAGSRLPNEGLRLQEEAKKTSTLFIPGSPYSPAQASSHAASIQAGSTLSGSGSGSGSGVGSMMTAPSVTSSRSGESLVRVRGVSAIRGKRSMPQLVNTPDALAGRIPRTDTPPPIPGAFSTAPPVPPKDPSPKSSTVPAQGVGEEALIPPAAGRFLSGSDRTQSSGSSGSEKRREKEKWWLGRFGGS